MTTREASNDTDGVVELLSTQPTNDDLDDLLEAAAPRRRSKLTIALVAALIFVIGFFAGSVSEKLSDSISEAQLDTVGDVEETPAADAGPIVTGHVFMLDDGLVYVERSDGSTVKVHVSDGTLIGLSQPGHLTDLAPGDAVIVHGETAEDGSIEASRIQQSRPGP